MLPTDPALLVNILAPETAMTITATITGDRTNHPRHGATSDLMVAFSSDRDDEGPFAYYIDAYRFARAEVGEANIRRNGKRARCPGPAGRSLRKPKRPGGNPYTPHYLSGFEVGEIESGS